MITNDQHRQVLLSELIERSVKIDSLLAKSRQEMDDLILTDLELLRAQQRKTTEILHALEVPDINAWENIGGGG
jgi:hypothetical protein